MKTFSLCLFDGAMIVVDNINFQYNSLMFALIIWSTIFMLKKRFLLSALLYCAAVLTKQMAIFYSGVYVGYLLVHYVIECCASSSPEGTSSAGLSSASFVRANSYKAQPFKDLCQS